MVKRTFRRKKSGKRSTTRKYKKSKRTHRRRRVTRGGGRILPGFNRINPALRRGIFDAFRNNPMYAEDFVGKTNAQMLDLIYSIVAYGRVNSGGVAVPPVRAQTKEIDYIEEDGHSVPTTLTVSGDQLKVQVWQPRTPRHRWSIAAIYDHSSIPDYRERSEFNEELLASAMHPDRIDSAIRSGYSIQDVMGNR